MITKGMMSSESSEWETPQALFDELNNEFHFTLDVCATGDNAKCEQYYSRIQDGLAQKWEGICWMNPPYGRQIGKWLQKAYESSRQGATVVCLIPSRTDTAWWHRYCMEGDIRFLRGRLYFKRNGASSDCAPFPSAIVIFRPHEQPR